MNAPGCLSAGMSAHTPALLPYCVPLQVKEAEDRLELGVHYQIPYPRMTHAPQFRKRQYMDVPIIQ